MNNSEIPIVFSTNDYYVPYMAAMMQSIMENADHNRQYIFFVFYQEINDNNKYLLENQISLFSCFSLEFINVAEYLNKYNLFTSRHITVETYFRLLIPKILSDYSKAIYLDGDMICCTNIANLFDIDIENFLLAAVRDTGVSWYYSPNHSNSMKNLYSILLQLKNPDEYFCAGMCVFNIELFNKFITTEKLFELAASRNWQCHDQDLLNYFAEGKTLLLPFHWNLMYTNESKYLPDHLKDEYISAFETPKIIHYKPWRHDIYIPHFELFWKYATRTPFITEIIQRMKDKEYVSNKFLSVKERIISNIIHRRGISLRFLLVDCVKAWLIRDKK